MLRSGISSVSYRNSQAETIIAAARAAGLGGIEWTADTHAPHGDLERAESLMNATLRAGLTVSAYGSFYRVGLEDRQGLSFKTVLAGALRLQTPIIRVWSAPLDEENHFQNVTREAASIADEAGRHGITVCLEAHEKSIVYNYDRLADVVAQTAHPFLKACWSPLFNCDEAERCRGAELLRPHLSLIHVRNWTRSYHRRPLSENADCCKHAITALAEQARSSSLDFWALIEYLEDENQETLNKEAQALTSFLSR